MLSCGSLAQVREERAPAKSEMATRSPKGTASPRSRKRRSRRSRSRRCGGDDPLSIVGSDINVRDHPLAALERRDDDDKPRPRKEGRNYIEERLQRLQGQIYKGDRSLSPCTVASVRKRGLDEIGTLLLASSSLSSHTSDEDDEGRKLERRAIKRIHGRSRPAPACPTCKGELTYLCLSKDGHSVNVREAQEEGDSSKGILQRLLPPLCIQCQTQMVYEQSKCKQAMIDNFNAWIEGGRDAREESDEGEEGCSHNRRIAKLIVVNSSRPAEELQKGEPEELGVQVSASFGSSHADITPRLSNRSERSEEAPFEFVASAAPAPQADENATEGDGEDCEKEEAALPADETEAAVVDDIAPEQAEAHDSQREGISPDYFSDDDPFSELGDEEVDDDTTAFEPVSGVLSGDSDQQLGSTESIALIHTESEERAILESHSTTKEIATVQIAKELIRGHEITPSQCERCRMPMMANDEGEAECVTCPAIGRKAKRVASKKRRRASNASSGADDCAAAIAVGGDGVGNACQQVNLNALEEGLAGSTSNGESIGHSVEEGPSLHEQPTSSSIGLNPIDSDRSDYWVRHSASQLQVARNAERQEAQQVGGFPFSFSSHSSASQSEHGNHPTANEEGEQLSQADSYHRSLSEVSETHDSQPEEGLNPTAVGGQLNRSLSDHHHGSLSEVSDTRGPSYDACHSIAQVASTDEPIRQAADQVIQDCGLPNLGPSSESSPYQRSSDLSSQCQSDTKEARTTEYHQLYHQPHHCQSNLSSSDVSDYHAPSEESSTRCPQSLPSDDMIWHHEFHRCASEPARAYPLQSCSSESSSEVRSIEAISDSHGEAQSDPLLVLANAATAQIQRSDVETEVTTQDNRVDSVQISEREEICVGGSEAPEVSETRAPASNPSHNDVSTENSLRARIARLAESLKEVAEQLPSEENAAQLQCTPVVPPKQECLAPNDSTSQKKPCESTANNQTSPVGDRDRQDRDKLRPIPSPDAIKQDIVNQSPHQRKVVEETLPSVERTRHNSLQKHERMLTSQSSPAMRNMFSPINVGADGRFDLFDDREGKERQSSKERKERRSSKGKKRRSHAKQKMLSPDPPGRRMDTLAVDARDPDDDRHAQTCTYASPKPKRRHGKPSRDPPPDEAAGDTRVITSSVFDGVTPKAKGKRQWVDRTPRNKPASETRCQEYKCTYRSPEKTLRRESIQLDAPSWDNEEVREPLQTSNSFGDSSLGDLFKTIDEIEDDFQTIVASMPGSEDQTLSTKSTLSCDDKHSLVEIHLNNAGSFESTASDEITDVVQRMQRIKNFIAHMDSADDEDESRCSGQISEGEMSELLSKLTSAAESLRAIDGDWED